MGPWLSAALGGVIIGLAATLLLLANGRLAGISGIASGLLSRPSRHNAWRWAFMAGLCAGGVLLLAIHPQAFPPLDARSGWLMACAGLAVGFGTQLGGGCTSGHGVCGLSRRSPRSLIAVLVFMTTGAITVFMIRGLS